jgi:peptidoglycan/xylan/chitin deacetylase (PgdA/CDA1 family)
MMRHISRLTNDGLAIFLFHGVIKAHRSAVRNYIRKHLDELTFVSFLEELRNKGVPLSMDQVVEFYSSGTPWPPRSFAITFDDGFENNYSVAAPILSDLRIPATFYVSTDLIDQNHMSWIDRIEYSIEAVTDGALSFPWDSKRIWPLATVADKINALRHLRSYVKGDPNLDTDEIASNICRQLCVEETKKSSDQLDQKMTWSQVSALNRDPDFIVGGHSHNHVNLAFLDEPKMRNEIDTCLDLLKTKANMEATHFSYPEGLENCFSPSVISYLRSKGIVCSPSAIDGINAGAEDLFHLRRIFVM